MGEGAQGTRGEAEEQAVEAAAVGADERVEGVRQGEDDVEVRHRQQHRLLRGHPLRPLFALALGTVAVAAGVVGDAAIGAALALLDMPAQSGGAARRNGPQHRALLERRRLRTEVLLPVRAHDVGHLTARARPAAWLSCRRHRQR